MRVSAPKWDCYKAPMARNRIALRVVYPHGEWIDMRAERVLRSFPIEGTDDRVVLFSWSTNPEPLQHNVARVDRHGNVAWRAELPTGPKSDCFNALARDGDGFVASTFSGKSIWLSADGRVERVTRAVAYLPRGTAAHRSPSLDQASVGWT